MNQCYIYDIRTSESAMRTLVNFTGVEPPIWEKYFQLRGNYQYDDDLIEDVISKCGRMPPNYEDWIFVYFHVTTSANKCRDFEVHGIMDLKKAYLCPDTELRQFLDSKGIKIDLSNCLLKYGNHEYSIAFGNMPRIYESEEHACWSIGRKFYYDFTTCGFLSVWADSPYGGYVHHRPEILSDIDCLLHLSLSQEWSATHEPFEIVAMVHGSDIVYDGEDNQSNNDKIINYLTKAYNTAFGSPSEKILLLKNNVQVPPQRIVEISPLKCWRA